MPDALIRSAAAYYDEVFLRASRTKDGDLIVCAVLFSQLIKRKTLFVGALLLVAFPRVEFPPAVMLIVADGCFEIVEQPFVDCGLGWVYLSDRLGQIGHHDEDVPQIYV